MKIIYINQIKLFNLIDDILLMILITSLCFYFFSLEKPIVFQNRSSSLIRDAISNNTFLKHLEQSQIEEIVACMYKKQIPHGCFIIREGEPGDALYVVSGNTLLIVKKFHKFFCCFVSLISFLLS